MRQAIILAILIVFVLTGQATAVKRVPKSEDRPNIETQKPDKAVNSSDQKAVPSQPPQQREKSDRNSLERKEAAKPSQPAKPDQSRMPSKEEKKEQVKPRDRFIDDNGDGLNDRYKKPPETVKKKKEDDNQTRKSTSRIQRNR